MKCQYCKHPLKLSHYENNKEVSIWDCLSCPIMISFSYLGEKLIKTSFFFERNEKRYIWSNDHVKEYSYITVLEPLQKNMLNYNPNILKLPKIINVTPENLYEKFSFYMTFA
jgi:hypothetical protein